MRPKFTSTAKGPYWADVRNYELSGRLGSEVHGQEPQALDPLESYFSVGAFMGGGLGGTRQLSESPFGANAELNEWRSPAPLPPRQRHPQKLLRKMSKTAFSRRHGSSGHPAA